MKKQGTRIIPCLVYDDAPAAIDWLKKAFGFECQLRVEGEGVEIAHAQLVCGDMMVMLSSVRSHADEYGRHFASPQAGQKLNQAIFAVVDEIAPHYERACAAGAEVVLPLTPQDYGGEGYTVRDPEGHIWSFGSYNPWTEDA